MPLSVHTGTAFFWRPTAIPAEATDVVRVLDEDGVTLGVLANGYEGGFSVCWPPASRLILDLFVEAWRKTAGSVRERLGAAFARAGERFAAQAPALSAPDAGPKDDVPVSTLLAVAVEETTAHLAWIGGDVAIVARDGKVAFETKPHSLVERLRRDHPELTDLSVVPSVLVRVIGRESLDTPDHLATEVANGDTVILLSRAPFCGPVIAAADAAALAMRVGDPSALAHRLAEAGLTTTEAPYAAVAVLRLEPAS